jgi:acetoacetate decarboxylase
MVSITLELPMLHGFSLPLSPSGIANLAPFPPWHYVGDLLVIAFQADPAAVAAVLPPTLTPHPAGNCLAYFCDWQFTSDGSELRDPVRSQYQEFFVVVGAYDGEREVTTCPYIFVNQDASMLRGLIQGFPKQFGAIALTRAFPVPSPAAPTLGPGGVFAATLAAHDRRLVEATVTLEQLSTDGAPFGSAPLLLVRHFPRLEAGRHHEPAIHELVQHQVRDRQSSPIWEGTATLRFFESPAHELHALAPIQVGRGYRYSMALTIDDQRMVRDLRHAEGADA